MNISSKYIEHILVVLVFTPLISIIPEFDIKFPVLFSFEHLMVKFSLYDSFDLKFISWLLPLFNINTGCSIENKSDVGSLLFDIMIFFPDEIL